MAERTYTVKESTKRELEDLIRTARHTSGPGTKQLPWGVAVRQPAVPQRAIARPSQDFVAFKVSSILDNEIGRYNAKTFDEQFDFSVIGNLTEDELGTLATADDAIVWHPPEIIGAGALLINGIYQGRLIGVDEDGKKIILLSDDSAVVIVKVTGNATGGGKYIGRVMSLLGAGGTVPETGDLAESDIGSAGSTDVLILNEAELGQTTHDLTTGTPKSKYFPAIKSPRPSSAGKSVYVIAGFDWEACS